MKLSTSTDYDANTGTDTDTNYTTPTTTLLNNNFGVRCLRPADVYCWPAVCIGRGFFARRARLCDIGAGHTYGT